MKQCVLNPEKLCDDCGECDKCDLDPQKICDNCGKCIGFDAKSRAVIIEGIEQQK